MVRGVAVIAQPLFPECSMKAPVSGLEQLSGVLAPIERGSRLELEGSAYGPTYDSA